MSSKAATEAWEWLLKAKRGHMSSTWVCRDPLGDRVGEKVPQKEVARLPPAQRRVSVPAETPVCVQLQLNALTCNIGGWGDCGTSRTVVRSGVLVPLLLLSFHRWGHHSRLDVDHLHAGVGTDAEDVSAVWRCKNQRAHYFSSAFIRLMHTQL